MGTQALVPFNLIFVLLLLLSGIATAIRSSPDGSESWGYVQVRPKAQMFWVLYTSPNRINDPANPWPIVLWLQGGPGSSGVGYGNFQEIGPLDMSLMPRNSTWLQKAHLLFVDYPVGTGYSYVEDDDLFVKTDVEAATDGTTFLKELFNSNETLQESPVYIVAESYGGKFAVTLALSALKAIEAGELKLNLGGVALGDCWMSPEDFTSAWGPLLKDVARLDNNGLEKSNSLALKITQQIEAGDFSGATDSWGELEDVIVKYSNTVDFYHFLLDEKEDPLAVTATSELKQPVRVNRYSRYLGALKSPSFGDGDPDINTLMNGVIKQKFGIPQKVSWGGQAGDVFYGLYNDFMRPRIKEVDELLAEGVPVTIYTGQLDLISATKGTNAWIEKLEWDGLKTFLSMDSTPLYCGDKTTRGFTKSYKNLHFYSFLKAGHFVPVDQPCLALAMIGSITGSPTTTTPSGFFIMTPFDQKHYLTASLTINNFSYIY